jgi:hypothetical protein
MDANEMHHRYPAKDQRSTRPSAMGHRCSRRHRCLKNTIHSRLPLRSGETHEDDTTASLALCHISLQPDTAGSLRAAKVAAGGIQPALEGRLRCHGVWFVPGAIRRRPVVRLADRNHSAPVWPASDGTHVQPGHRQEPGCAAGHRAGLIRWAEGTHNPVSEERLRGLPFAPAGRQFVILPAALFLAAIFGRASDPTVLNIMIGSPLT